MNGFVEVTVTMPERLAAATLAAAEATGQRTGAAAIRIEHFIILSERAFEQVLEALGPRGTAAAMTACGGAGKTPERAANPAPAGSAEQRTRPSRRSGGQGVANTLNRAGGLPMTEAGRQRPSRAPSTGAFGGKVVGQNFGVEK